MVAMSKDDAMWKEAWVGTPFTGTVVIRKSASGDEFLAITSPSVLQKYGSDAEILDDGRTVGVSLEDSVAFGIVTRQGRTRPVAVNVWRTASGKSLQPSSQASSSSSAAVRGKGNGRSEPGNARTSKGAAKGNRKVLRMRMLGVVQKVNPKTGRHSVFCQDISDVYGRDAQIPHDEVPKSGMNPGDKVSFDIEEPKEHSRAPIFARNIQVYSARGQKRKHAVRVGDGEDIDGGEDLELKDEEMPEEEEELEPEAEELAAADAEEALAAQETAARAAPRFPPKVAARLRTEEPEENFGIEEPIQSTLAEPSTTAEWALAQERLFGGLPPLKSGWIRLRSKSSGLVYFYNTKSGESSAVEPRF